jgi:AcrR family transcriptional regulator
MFRIDSTIISEHNVLKWGSGTQTRGRRLSDLEHSRAICSESESGVKTRKPDRRIQRTRQLLHTALMSLIQERGFESLSVQDIIDRANVGRATFYAHFDSKEDLLASGIDGLRTSLQQRQRDARAGSAGADRRLFAFSHALFVHADEHRAVFRAMVGKRSGAVVQQLLHKMLVDLVRDEVRRMRPAGDSDATHVEAMAQFIGGGLFGLLLWWGNGKMRMPVDDVDATFRRLAIPAVEAAAS